MKEGTKLKSYKSIIPIEGTIKGHRGVEELEFPVLVIAETTKRYLVRLTEFSGENTFTFPKHEVTLKPTLVM